MTILARRDLLVGVVGSFLHAQTGVSPADVSGLRNGVSGRLIVPGDEEYDSARRLASFNPTTDKHPQAIVRCATADDVARAVVFTREHGVEVAVRSGGHDVLGASVCDGLVIDLSTMNAIHADPERRTVRVEAGVRSGQLNAALQRYGLAAALGCHPGVGVAGLTVGGGLGWLLGKYGAACDHLLGADLVTAEGKKLRASETENADLFWALRGGGGNFGIVTSLDFRLHPVDRVFGGVLVLRTNVAKFLRFYRTDMAGASKELTVETSLIAGEQPVIVAIVCWSGDASEGDRVLKPLRSFDAPVADWVDSVAYAHLTDRMAEVGSLLGRAPQQQQRGPGYGYWRGGSLRELSNAAADQIAAAMEHGPRGSSLGLGHYMHGEACRVKPGATPLVRTAGQVTYFFNTGWGDPRMAGDRMEWVDRCRNDMKPFSSRGAYINYLSVDEPGAVEASYGKNYDRLARIKKRYDPPNFFHRNRNIRPRRA